MGLMFGLLTHVEPNIACDIHGYLVTARLVLSSPESGKGAFHVETLHDIVMLKFRAYLYFVMF